MPITPFHLGPGLAVKAVIGHRFSLMVFGFSQVMKVGTLYLFCVLCGVVGGLLMLVRDRR